MKKSLLPMLALALLSGCGTPTQATSPALAMRETVFQSESRDGIAQLAQRFAERVWNAIDKDGDGNATPAPYRFFSFEQPSPGGCVSVYYFSYFRKEDRVRIRVDEKGYLNRDSFNKQFLDGVDVGMIRQVYQQSFDRNDSNRDHKISLDEFCRAIDGGLPASKSDFDDGNEDWPRDRYLSYSEYENLLFSIYVESYKLSR